MNNTSSGLLQEAVDKYNAADEAAHAKYPPSAAKRWCNCSASIKMSKGEDNKPNQYTAEGSLAHIICELLAKMVFASMAALEELVGDTYLIDDFEIEVTDEMIEACWLYAETLADDMLENDITDAHVGTLIKIEQRINIAGDCYGTSDCNMAVPFTKLIVYDFKYGAGVPVDVKDNYQMKCYAVGALNEYEADGSNSMMDVIELVIVQPRARHKDGEVRRWETTRDKILEFKAEIKEAMDKCKSNDPEFKSGDWCRWCPAKHKCQHMFEETQDIAKAAFDVVNDGSGGEVLTAMTDEQMLKILDNKDTIIGFLKAVEGHALARLETGGTLGAYKLVRGRATRKWSVDEDSLQTVFGDMDIYAAPKLLSPAQLEKKYKKNKGVTMKEAKAAIFDYVDPGEGKISIAPGHDKRDAVLLNAGEYFDKD